MLTKLKKCSRTLAITITMVLLVKPMQGRQSQNRSQQSPAQLKSSGFDTLSKQLEHPTVRQQRISGSLPINHVSVYNPLMTPVVSFGIPL